MLLQDKRSQAGGVVEGWSVFRLTDVLFLSLLCSSQNALFGMGNPLLDISAVVDKDFLEK